MWGFFPPSSLLPLDKLDKGTVTGVLAQVVAFLMPPRVCLLRGEWEETSEGTPVSLDKEHQSWRLFGSSDGGGGGALAKWCLSPKDDGAKEKCKEVPIHLPIHVSNV